MGAVASEAVAVARAVMGEGGWLVLVVLLLWWFARSAPGRDLAWVVCTELRYQYLRRRGYSKKELHDWLREREKARGSPDPT